MKKVSPYWWLTLLLAVCFTLGTLFVPLTEKEKWDGNIGSENAMKLLLGDGRKLFANEFLTMGDVYFHSGYYPSIFDKQETSLDVAAPAHGQADDADPNESFLGPPKDWIDALGRNFKPNKHTHLSSGGAQGNMKSTSVQEILPWLKLAADLNPKLIESYTVAAYWLRTNLHNPKQAERFLREGLHSNPDNYQLLFNLGQLYDQDYHETNTAINILKLAARRWQMQTPAEKLNKQNKIALDEIAGNLARLYEDRGDLTNAIYYLKMSKTVSPFPNAVQQRIDGVEHKLAAQPSAAKPTTH
jgi:tetratricopeptide (TPR) repeat protein